MIAPKLTSFKWKTQSEVSGLAQVFVHILDFPESNLWIWIGDASANLSNLSLALQYNNKNKNAGPQNKKTTPIATTILNPTTSDEASNKSKIVAQRLSKLLGGRPVYLSYSIPDMGLAEDLLGLSELEVQLFQLLKKQSSK